MLRDRYHFEGKKRHHRLAALLLVACCIFTSGCHMLPTSQNEFPQPGPYLTFSSAPYFLSTDMRSFAQQMQQTYLAQDPDPSLLLDEETIDALILQAVRLVSPEKKEIHEQLEKYGIYELPMGSGLTIDTDYLFTFTTSVQYTNSVYLTPPSIYYQAPTDQWIVAFGGSWISDDWKNGKGWGPEVGGRESFGVNISQHGDPVALVCDHVCGGLYSTDIYASIESTSNRPSDGTSSVYMPSDEDSVHTTNRSNGVSSVGYGFQLQDRVESEFPFLETFYLGYQWAGLCVYSSEFADLDATLTAYYIHTYGDSVGNGYELPLGEENALDGIPVNDDGSDDYFVRYSQSVNVSPAP